MVGFLVGWLVGWLVGFAIAISLVVHFLFTFRPHSLALHMRRLCQCVEVLLRRRAMTPSPLGMRDNNDAGGKEGCVGTQQPLPKLQHANDEGLTAQTMAARMAKDVAQRLPPSVAETINALAEETDAAAKCDTENGSADQNINKVGVLGCRHPVLRRHLFMNRLIIFFPFSLQPLASCMDYRTATMRLHAYPFSPT